MWRPSIQLLPDIDSIRFCLYCYSSWSWKACSYSWTAFWFSSFSIAKTNFIVHRFIFFELFGEVGTMHSTKFWIFSSSHSSSYFFHHQYPNRYSFDLAIAHWCYWALKYCWRLPDDIDGLPRPALLASVATFSMNVFSLLIQRSL